MTKKPYVAPELVTLGDVISITKAQFEPPFDPDANFPTNTNPPNIFTDNIVNGSSPF